MDNFYILLEIPYDAMKDQIISSYKNKINKFNNFKKILQEHIKEIKLLKTALYILTNDELKRKYDILLSYKINNTTEIQEPLAKTSKIISANEPNNIPVAGNHDEENTLDFVFNIDNSWMPKQNNSSDTNGKKIKVNANLLGDRIFSLPQYGKKQNQPSEIDMDLRKPLQGREDKTNQNL
jgi:DnaJ-class molecular chaperone